LLIFFVISFFCFVQISSSDAAQPLASSPSLQAAAEKSKAEVYWFGVQLLSGYCFEQMITFV